jgi:hypothetical protein
MGGGRTDQGGDENDGGEEHVSLHVESFVREKILLDYLCGASLVIFCAMIYKERMMLPHDIQKARVEVL